MAFTRALGSRSLRDSMRVNPGAVETERIITMMNTSAAVRQRMADLPAGRVAKPAEIADTIAFLASDRSAYTSGVIVTIDGGFCAAG